MTDTRLDPSARTILYRHVPMPTMGQRWTEQ